MTGNPTSSERTVPSESHVVRRRADLLLLVTGAGLVALGAAIASGGVPGWEETLFRAVNDLPHGPEWIVWPIQQLGMALAVPVGALVLWRLADSWRPPVVLLATATAIGWGAANLLRAAVARSRPAATLPDIYVGYDVPAAGTGYPSGHAIVAVTLATVLAPYMGRRGRALLAALTLLVMVARVYVGAHLPLDLLGGAACGLVLGSTVNLIAGIYRRPPAGIEPSPDS